MTDTLTDFLFSGEKIAKKLPKKTYLTDRRVVHYKSGYFSQSLVEIDYGSVSSVDFKARRRLALIILGLYALISGLGLLAAGAPIGLLVLILGLAVSVVGFVRKKEFLIFKSAEQNRTLTVPGTVKDARVARELIESFRARRPGRGTDRPDATNEFASAGSSTASPETEAVRPSYKEETNERPFVDEPISRPFEETPAGSHVPGDDDADSTFAGRSFRSASPDASGGDAFSGVPRRFRAGIRGVARNIDRRTASTGSGRPTSLESLRFRLEIVDSQGDVTDVVPIEIRSPQLSGDLREGDSLVILGRRDRRGLIKPKKVYNASTQSEISFNAGSFLEEVVKLVFGLVGMVAMLGLVGGIIAIFIEPAFGVPMTALCVLVVSLYSWIHRKRHW